LTKKEIAEIRKRFRIDRNAITRIRGCYVNEEKVILSSFDRTFGSLPEEERFKYLAIFGKTLSGSPGRNLLDVEFATDTVMNGEEHKLLMKLRESKLSDEAAAETFYKNIISSVSYEGNILILLIHETYDIPFKGKDNIILKEGSEEVYNYILCSVCPVTLSKPALSYFADENEFHDRAQDWQVEMPEFGFLFPAFDDRSANIYSALYYIKNPEEKHEDFAQAALASELPLTSVDQKNLFHEVLSESLGESFSYPVVQALQDQIRDRLEQNNADKNAEPLTLSGKEVGRLLSECGVPEPAVTTFERKYENEIGEQIPAENLTSSKLVIKTQDLVITAAAEQANGIQVREINGRKYLLVPIDDSIEVNGVNMSAL
jgi:hypothetical protein